ncbi:MAG: 30S ribosomal protein S20 [Mariprofundaceae bacterium]|nr:30S ribosomal protein S20 [Mariprofundaceae bacterium]
MANHVSSLKRARQDLKKRALNRSQRSTMRTAVKKLEVAIADGDKNAANVALKAAVSMIDRAGGKRLIHAKQASRRVSRLNAHVKAMA